MILNLELGQILRTPQQTRSSSISQLPPDSLATHEEGRRSMRVSRQYPYAKAVQLLAVQMVTEGRKGPLKPQIFFKGINDEVAGFGINNCWNDFVEKISFFARDHTGTSICICSIKRRIVLGRKCCNSPIFHPMLLIQKLLTLTQCNSTGISQIAWQIRIFQTRPRAAIFIPLQT